MSDDDERAGPTEALPGHESSPGISRDAANAAGQLAAQRRIRMRGLSVAAIGTATVAVLAVPWFFGLGGLSGLGFGATDPSATAAASEPVPSQSGAAEPSGPAYPNTSPAATPQAVPALPGMYPSRVTFELSQVLKAAAIRILPQATFGPMVVGFEDGQRLLQPFDVVDNGHGYYVGWAAVHNGRNEGLFAVGIWPGADDKKSPHPGCESAYFPRLGCENRTGPHGEQITIDMGKWENSETVEYRVKVHRADGVILMATVHTNTPAEGSYLTPRPATPTPPMTTDQLVELLLTPGLVLHLPG